MLINHSELQSCQKLIWIVHSAILTSLSLCFVVVLFFHFLHFPFCVISFHYLWLQVRFVRNVTSWREMKPGFYHGHVAYLDFSK